MLIRNVKSYADLENKKNLQAQMLQIAIDNESTLETRVKDYKNPNKPPPVPPQYKTNAELAQDTQLQQKELINNLTSIAGVNNFLALNVSQAIGQLRDGTANFLKVNKNFPVIKKRLEELGKYALDTDYIVEKIKEILEQIDEGLNLSIAGSTATMVFNQAIGSGGEIPSGQDIAPLLGQLQGMGNDFTTIYNQYQADEQAYRQRLAQQKQQALQQQQQAGGQQAQQALLPPDPFSTYVSQALAQTNNNDSLYGQLISRLYAIANVANSPLANDPDFIAVMTSIAELCDNSPSRFSLDNIDIIEQMERKLVQKQITKIIKGGAPPTAKIQSIINGLDPADYISAVAEYNIAGAGAVFTLPPASNFTKAYQNLLNAVKSIKNKADTLRELRELKDKLDRLLQGVAGLQTKFQGQLAQAQAQAQALQAQQALQTQQLIQARNRVVGDTKIIMDNVLQNPAQVRERLLQQGANPYTNVDYYPIKFKNQPFTFDGTNNLSPDNTVIERRNVVISEVIDGGGKRKENMDIRDLPFTFTQLPRQQAGRKSGGQAKGFLPPVNITYELIKGDFTPLSPQEVALFQNQKDQYLTLYVLTGTQKQPQNQTKIVQERYTPQQLADIVRNQEINPLKQVLDNDPNYDPTANQGDRKIIQHGFGLKKGKGYSIYDLGSDIKGFFGGAIPKGHHIMPDGRLMKDSEHCEYSGGKGLSFKEFMFGSQGQGLMCPQNHNPVMAKDGKMYGNRCKAQAGGGADENYKVDGMGFMNRKIKIGKGIAVEEQPRYRTFGKYIIHIPYLENDNVLNVKFQSMGSIPSIKPVSIDDNFKEFIMDILNTSQVNQQHYNSLTEAEKAHFHKIVKGAGLSNALKFKADDKIDDKKDVKRLDILVGQIVAGNDNDKVMKEAKELIKKCVSNGSITRHRGMDLLFQIE